MIKVIGWKTTGTNGEVLYRLDRPEDGARLFRDLYNVDTIDAQVLRIFQMTEDDWKSADHLSKKSA
jgi:hypothetical protein